MWLESAPLPNRSATIRVGRSLRRIAPRAFQAAGMRMARRWLSSRARAAGSGDANPCGSSFVADMSASDARATPGCVRSSASRSSSASRVPGSGIATASWGEPATDPTIRPPTVSSASLTCSTVAAPPMRTAISPRATRRPSGVVSVCESSWRRPASRSCTAPAAVAPGAPGITPGRCRTTTMPERAFPAPSVATTSSVFDPSTSGTPQVNPSPASVAAWPLQTTRAMPDPPSRALPLTVASGWSNQASAPGASIESSGGDVSGAAGGGGERGGRGRRGRRRGRGRRLSGHRRHGLAQAPGPGPLQRLQLPALLLDERAALLLRAVRAEERAPARGHLALEGAQPLGLRLAGLGLRRDRFDRHGGGGHPAGRGQHEQQADRDGERQSHDAMLFRCVGSEQARRTLIRSVCRARAVRSLNRTIHSPATKSGNLPGSLRLTTGEPGRHWSV